MTRRHLAACGLGSLMMVAAAGCMQPGEVVSQHGAGSEAVSRSAQQSAPAGPAAPSGCAKEPQYLVRVTKASETYAYRLDGFGWSPTAQQCVDSRTTLQSRFQDEAACAQLAPAADNPGYDPQAKPPAPLNGVQAQFGTAC